MSSSKQVTSTIDFSSVLAAAVHDMKNSLFLLIQSIETLSDALSPHDTKAREQVASVHYEASRLNTNLVQILSLYRAELESLPITVDESFIKDLVEDVVGSNALYVSQKNIDISIDIEEDLSWYLDSELIYLLLNDVIINAMRYGTSKILVSAHVDDNDFVTLRIEDDGSGYPRHVSRLHLSVFRLCRMCKVRQRDPRRSFLLSACRWGGPDIIHPTSSHGPVSSE